MPSDAITLQPPHPDQRPLVRNYLAQLARDEAVPRANAGDEFLARTLFGPSPVAIAHLVHRGDEGPCGLTIHSWKWGAFSGVMDMYLHVLVIDPASRGRGIGRAVMTQLLDIAAAHGASRLELLTTRDNADASAFYDRLGLAQAAHMVVRRCSVAS